MLVVGILAGIVVLAVIVGVVFFMVIGKDTVTATDVKVGDCLKEIPDSTRVLTVQTIECEQPHAGEVFSVLTMPEGDFPGQPAIDEYADKCSPRAGDLFAGGDHRRLGPVVCAVSHGRNLGSG